MTDKNAFLDVVGNSPQAKILDVLITGRRLDYSATGIIRAADIGRATFYQIFPKLLKQGLVRTTRKLGNMQLYTINENNAIALALIKIHQHILMTVLEKHGKESEMLERGEQLVT